jgi:hypothetical protein
LVNWTSSRRDSTMRPAGPLHVSGKA